MKVVRRSGRDVSRALVEAIRAHPNRPLVFADDPVRALVAAAGRVCDRAEMGAR